MRRAVVWGVACAVLGGAIVWWLAAPGVPFVEVVEERRDTLAPLSGHGRGDPDAALEGCLYDARHRRLYPCLGTPADPAEIQHTQLIVSHLLQHQGTSLGMFRRRLFLSRAPDLELDPARIGRDEDAPGAGLTALERIHSVETLRIRRRIGPVLQVRYGARSAWLLPGRAWALPPSTRSVSPASLLEELARLDPAARPPAEMPPEEVAARLQALCDGKPEAAFTTQVTIRYHGRVRPVARDLLAEYRQAAGFASERRFAEARALAEELLAVAPEHPALRALREAIARDEQRLGAMAQMRGVVRLSGLDDAAVQALAAARQRIGPGWIAARHPDDPLGMARYTAQLEAADRYTLRLPAGAYVLSVTLPGLRSVSSKVTVGPQGLEQDFTVSAADVMSAEDVQRMAEALRAERLPAEAPAAAEEPVPVPAAPAAPIAEAPALPTPTPTAAPSPETESPGRRFDQLYGRLLQARQKLEETARAARARGALPEQDPAHVEQQRAVRELEAQLEEARQALLRSGG